MNEDYTMTAERYYCVFKTAIENCISFFSRTAQTAIDIFCDVPSVNIEARRIERACFDMDIEIPSSNSENIYHVLKSTKRDFDEFTDGVMDKLAGFIKEDFDEVKGKPANAAQEYLEILHDAKQNTDFLFERIIECSDDLVL